jgi:hypothetical protein
MSIEVMKNALEALERIGMKDWVERKESAIAELKQAISEAEKQEPVAYIHDVTYSNGAKGIVLTTQRKPYDDDQHSGHTFVSRPLYTHPAPAAPVVVSSFIRRRLEREVEMATNPRGMGVHDGRTRALSADIAYLLKLIDAQPDTQPKQQEWVGLTDREVGDAYDFTNTNSRYGHHHSGFWMDVYRAIEAKLKEKNTKKG